VIRRKKMSFVTMVDVHFDIFDEIPLFWNAFGRIIFI